MKKNEEDGSAGELLEQVCRALERGESADIEAALEHLEGPQLVDAIKRIVQITVQRSEASRADLEERLRRNKEALAAASEFLVERGRPPLPIPLSEFEERREDLERRQARMIAWVTREDLGALFEELLHCARSGKDNRHVLLPTWAQSGLVEILAQVIESKSEGTGRSARYVSRCALQMRNAWWADSIDDLRARSDGLFSLEEAVSLVARLYSVPEDTMRKAYRAAKKNPAPFADSFIDPAVSMPTASFENQMDFIEAIAERAKQGRSRRRGPAK